MIPGARLILLGRQGAGKGTQCVRLSRHYVVPHISTGDILRAAVREGTELGLMAKAVMDADFPGIANHPMYDSFKGFSLRALAPLSNGKITDAQLTKVEAESEEEACKIANEAYSQKGFEATTGVVVYGESAGKFGAQATSGISAARRSRIASRTAAPTIRWPMASISPAATGCRGP